MNLVCNDFSLFNEYDNSITLLQKKKNVKSQQDGLKKSWRGPTGRWAQLIRYAIGGAQLALLNFPNAIGIARQRDVRWRVSAGWAELVADSYP